MTRISMAIKLTLVSAMFLVLTGQTALAQYSESNAVLPQF